jgi:hypothetical protein
MRIALIVLLLLVIGCGKPNQVATEGVSDKQLEDKDLAIIKCIEECKKADRINIDIGPCLSDNIIKDWVCDVAHDPREAVDNLKDNQCSAYGKTARHFVEVNADCEVIRVY